MKKVHHMFNGPISFRSFQCFVVDESVERRGCEREKKNKHL